jgi:hypothetical protein
MSRKPSPRSKEERITSYKDGRSLRATGRTVQLNLKVTPKTKARLLALAEVRGCLLAEAFEDALAALEAETAADPALARRPTQPNVKRRATNV